MTTDDHDAKLTAFALNDPSLTDADRTAIEAAVATDPAAKREVEEVRELAGLLTAGFAAELTAADPKAVTVPAKAKRRRWTSRLIEMGIAASIMVGLFGLLLAGVTSARRDSVQAVREAYAPQSLSQAVQSSSPIPRPDTEPSLRYQPAEPAAAPTPTPPSRGPSQSPAKPRVVINAEEELASGTVISPPPSFEPVEQPVGKVKGDPVDAKPAAPHFYDVTVQTPNGVRKFRYERDQDGRFQYKGAVPTNPDGTATGDVQELNRLPGLRPSGDRFPPMIENAFIPVEGLNALSTFGVDVDTASYAIVRNLLNNGQRPDPNAVRLEEIVNYFPYQDKPPTGDDPFAVTVEIADCPWKAGHRLARIGLKAKPIATDKRPPSNLVFLIDVSGSMNQPNKLPLVKSALRLLVGQLGENDRVAMVVYAGNAGLVLDSTSAVNKDTILGAIDRLEAGGSTNGSGGLQQAYDVAVSNFIKNGTNRVVLCTDGDWNVGVTGTDAIVRMIEEKRKTGVFLSVFGFGMGNLRDEMMVKLAGKGNGNYGYIDTIREAHKALVEQLSGTLVTVAKDVKIQVEFNPAAVKSYRLLGYEKRALAAKDFADDTKDAGEMGAGHVVTALYELVPAGASEPPGGEGLRYQAAPEPKPAPAVGNAKEAFLVKMRHKKPDGDVSTLRELPVSNTSVGYRDASEDFRFSAAAAAFALVLRGSEYKGSATLELALELAESATRFDPNGYRAEFVELVRKARPLSGQR